MAVTTDQLTSGHPAQALAGQSRRPGNTPRLADGLELLGEFKGSGYTQPPSLVRRRDGQVIQMSLLLYEVTSKIDGSRDMTQIAVAVSEHLGRSLDAAQVRHLITTKLQPLGIIAAEGGPAVPPRANPLLALRARGTLLPEGAANLVGVLLRPLFRPVTVAAVVASVIAVDCWLFRAHGVSIGLQQMLRDPADLLIVAGLSVVSAAFHECGHAAGCRYSGARPGVIGFGIYLVWPSFYTNVTDAYRLSRAGRLRTDLGGLYFNLIFILAMAALYATTSAGVLLVVIAVTHLEMLEQLLPFVRFDGYFVLTDLTGVPDLFARIVPILRTAVRTGRQDPRVAGLRRRARLLVTGWVLCVTPLVAAMLAYLVLRLPQLNRALWLSSSRQARLMSAAATGHHLTIAAVDAIGVALLALSAAGTLYIAVGLARRLTALGLRWSARRPARRGAVIVAGLGCLAMLVAYWCSRGELAGW